ncbi:MAG TPA: putative metal-dependent hydrolase [Gemmatimonadales bacterium]|jgi:hypothetical protein|nr:putative metal-dependent hydrolase [Gemmatimonadales bacterium]
MTDLRYPIGRFQQPERVAPAERTLLVKQIAACPAELRRAVAGLDRAQLDTPYRPDGWTVRQVVHHVPDSHINAYVRMKLALTEDAPAIKTYEEARWAELPDVEATAPEVSLALLESLHARWTTLLTALRPEQFGRTFRHPELGPVTLDAAIALYAWHGRHHVAHVTSLRARMGW